MSASTDLTRVTFIVLREMRRPLMTLIVVYSISIFGMVFIPGPVVDGETQYMSIFHAFYFMTYTATTTGFGEIPFAFSNAQRFWAIACLYLSVVTWFYAIGSIIHLIQNPFFLRAFAQAEFSRSVQRIPGPFFIICGFGDTGSVLTRGLTEYDFPAVVIDADEERIKALKLRNYQVPVAGLCADASAPKHLLQAGLKLPNCKAIVAITNSEDINLKISATARVMNPGITIITKSKKEDVEESLACLGGEVHIVDPFKTFAKVLAASMHHPGFYAMNNWLVKEEGATLDRFVQPPKGKWIISGFGRMGHEIRRVLAKHNTQIVVIDEHENTEGSIVDQYIVGRTSSSTLSQAGIEETVGIVAGTDNDGHNLGILLNARYMHENIFTIVRQNRHLNEIAFREASVDMVMQPTLVTARRILFLLIAPLLKSFFRYLLEDEPGRTEVLEDVIDRLRDKVGSKNPQLVTIDFNKQRSQSVMMWLEQGKDVFLGDLLKDPDNRDRELDLVVFVIKSGGKKHILPDKFYKIKAGDQMLYCGTMAAQRLLNATINSEYKLFYIQNGVFLPRSYLAQWFVKKTKRIGI